jgi:DEAD/DEAH box helicase domain-containing protein
MVVKKLISRWNADPTISANIYARHTIPAKKPETSSIPESIHPAIVSALNEKGIIGLYSHQANAWDLVQAGDNIVVSTGTSSGKSLCYNLPIVDRVLRDSDLRALYLFPTKALAQDQLQALEFLAHSITQEVVTNPPSFAVYDGDTPRNSRPIIRTNASIIISNPDMLHYGILPHHTAWEQFFSNLKFIVIDEIHIYRGVFGSHVANIIRRLKRITKFYDSSLQFILTSATIANPTEFAEHLVEEKVSLIDFDGSSRGKQDIFIYNPPIIDLELGIRRSAIHESVRLADDFLAYDIQSIIFGRSRRTVELILAYLRQKGQTLGVESEVEIRGYRSGYLPHQRRAIERGIRRGEVKVVVATNALELGIDIGGMEAVILVGYPGTIAATLQQAGRAGRGEAASIAVLVTTADPLDQYLALHPEYLFDRSPEQALINPDNLIILLAHIQCAAFELNFDTGENFGTVDAQIVQEFLDILTENRELHKSGERYFWMADSYPAQNISLRSTTTQNVTLQVHDHKNSSSEESTTLGILDRVSAMWMTHPNAIYLHEGESYYVNELDLENNIAWLDKTETDYFTEPRRSTDVHLLDRLWNSDVIGGKKSYGEVNVISQVIGFRMLKWFTHQQIDIRELSLPPTEIETTAYWLSLSENTVNKLRNSELWLNDPNDYGLDWQIQRDLSRERDGFICQGCGAPEANRAHDVHHIIPFRTFTNHKHANQIDNLVTLCPKCHRRAETSIRVRSGLAGAAYVFRHLAPLFLMCDRRDLGVHSDPKSRLSEGAPSIIIYDQIPAGIGLSQRLYEVHKELVGRALELVTFCKCPNGCPSCVGPLSEGGQGGKPETRALLKELSG